MFVLSVYMYVCVCVCVIVSLFAHNLGTGRAIVFKFLEYLQVPPEWSHCHLETGKEIIMMPPQFPASAVYLSCIIYSMQYCL